jgi:glycosyltransferase A (GT-A) superfamily protein (DUF2064 family)
MQDAPKIALIFFSRRAEQEAMAKPWLGNSKRAANTALAQLLITNTQAIIAGTGMACFWISEEQQRGERFGQRLANAFADVFAQGYTAAIAVGNDSPGLAGTNWDALAQLMCEGKNLLGPTLRGGAYLIGLQAEGFDAQLFAAQPWQTGRIYSALKANWDESDLEELPPLRDLNTLQDLLISASTHAGPFASQLRRILSNTPSRQSRDKILLTQTLPSACRVRPPPFPPSPTA